MLGLLSLGLVGIGLNIYAFETENYKILNEKIKNEKVLTYPHDTNQYMKNILLNKNVLLNKNELSNNVIVKIPNNLLDKKFSIGKIKINKISKKNSTIIYYDKINDCIKIKDKETECKEPFIEHLLFPTCKFKEFEFDNKMFYNNKIKILFDNAIISKSNGNMALINKYINTIENNSVRNFIPKEYFSNLIISGCNFELEENFITPFDDLYLIIKPCLQLKNQETNNEKVKFNIIVLGNNKDKIIEEKYIDELNVINRNMVLSYFCTITGCLTLLFIKN